MPSLPIYTHANQLRALILALFLTALPGPAIAQEKLIESVERLEDKTASLEVWDILQETFNPASETLSLGYTTSAEWLRLRIQPTPNGEDVVIMFGPGKPDDLIFYSPDLDELEDPIKNLEGLRYLPLQPNWPSPLPAFVVTPPEGGADYFVRIKTTGSVWLEIKALPLPRALLATEQNYIFQLVYFSIMLALLLWSLQTYFITREHLFLWFTGLQTTWLLNNILYLGYGSSFPILFPPDIQSVTLRVSVFAAAFFSITFHRTVMKRFHSGWLSIRLFDTQLIIIVIAFLLFLTYDRVLALQINAMCLAATPFVFMLNITTARKAEQRGLTTLRVVYGVLSVSFLLNAFAVLGFVNIKTIVVHGYMIHGFSTGLLMFILLNFTARNILQAAQEAEADQVNIKIENRIQKEKNQSLSEFIEMLSHEVKNALAVITMTLSTNHLTDMRRTRITDLVRGLTALIDRCNMLIMLEDDEQLPSPKACDLVEILQKLLSKSTDPEHIKLHWQDQHLIYGDPVLLEVVFSNLLDNAVKYAPNGSDITIEVLSVDGGQAVIFGNMKGDAGSPDSEQVFKKYYRNSLAKKEIGSGLGLYIAHKLSTRMAGTLEYQPRENRVVFRLWFPC